MTSKPRKQQDQPAPTADETQVSGFVLKPAEPKPDPDTSGGVPWGGDPSDVDDSNGEPAAVVDPVVDAPKAEPKSGE